MRELREKTGLEAAPENVTLVAAAPTPAGQFERTDKSVIRVTYAIARAETVGEPTRADDATAVQWVGRSALDGVDWAFEEGRTEAQRAFETVRGRSG